MHRFVAQNGDLLMKLTPLVTAAPGLTQALPNRMLLHSQVAGSSSQLLSSFAYCKVAPLHSPASLADLPSDCWRSWQAATGMEPQCRESMQCCKRSWASMQGDVVPQPPNVLIRTVTRIPLKVRMMLSFPCHRPTSVSVASQFLTIGFRQPNSPKSTLSNVAVSQAAKMMGAGQGIRLALLVKTTGIDVPQRRS